MKKLLIIFSLLITKLSFANGTSVIDLGGAEIKPRQTATISLFDGKLDKRYVYDVECKISVNTNTLMGIRLNDSSQDKTWLELNGMKMQGIGFLYAGSNKLIVHKIENNNHSMQSNMQIASTDDAITINVENCFATPYWHP